MNELIKKSGYYLTGDMSLKDLSYKITIGRNVISEPEDRVVSVILEDRLCKMSVSDNPTKTFLRDWSEILDKNNTGIEDYLQSFMLLYIKNIAETLDVDNKFIFVDGVNLYEQ